MDLGSIFLILALGLMTALFVVRPFLEKPAQAAHREEGDQSGSPAAALAHESELAARRSALLAERDRVVSALSELDFDHSMGKVSDDDYPQQRSELLASGAAVLQALEEAGYAVRTVSMPSAGSQPAGERPAAAGGRNRGPVVPVQYDELEELIAAHRKARQEKATGFCPRCGRPISKSDLFCSRCGAEIHIVESKK